MKLTHQMPGDGSTRLNLSGRMDVAGTESIDQAFTSQAASHKAAVIVDLSGVGFLASIGIRTLLTSAKAQGHRGGRLVLLNPQPMVESVLATAGVDTLIPIFRDLDAALLDLQPVMQAVFKEISGQLSTNEQSSS